MFESQMDLHDSILSCEDIEYLISFALDGELDADVQVLLTEHLATCSACRQRQVNFDKINSLVADLGRWRAEDSRRGRYSGDDVVLAKPADLARTNSQRPIAGIRSPTKGRQRIDWQKISVRIVPFAVAAAVVISVAVPYFSKPRQANSAEFAAQIAEPMVSISRLNDQRLRDQIAVCETLRLELRALKLEMTTIDDHRLTESVSIRIDRLFERISEIQNVTVLNQPEN